MEDFTVELVQDEILLEFSVSTNNYCTYYCNSVLFAFSRIYH
jgi:hypothetical protein